MSALRLTVDWHSEDSQRVIKLINLGLERRVDTRQAYRINASAPQAISALR